MQDADVVRAGDPVAIAATIWAMVHGLVSLRLSNHIPLDPKAFDKFFLTSTDDLLRGLAP